MEDYVIDYEIYGEILIPLENNTEKTDYSSLKVNNLEEVLEKHYKDFRSILFQGELLRFYVVLKLDTNSQVNEMINELYFKFEFDSAFDNNLEQSNVKDMNDPSTLLFEDNLEKNIVI